MYEQDGQRKAGKESRSVIGAALTLILALGAVTGAWYETKLDQDEKKLYFDHHSGGLIFGVATENFPDEHWKYAPPLTPLGLHGLHSGGGLVDGSHAEFEGWEFNY